VKGERRDWSFVPTARVREYLEESQRLVTLARQHKISAFAAALAGVAFIRNALAVMGGQPEWWRKLITSTKANPFDEGGP